MSTRPDITLLFLNAGRRNELIRCFRRALTALRLDGRLLATDIHGLAPALYEADAHFLLPRSRESAFPRALARLCRRERVSLIIPLIDPDMPVLARLHAALAAAGTCVLLSPASAIDICRDKVKTAAFLRAHGFPTPATLTPAQARRHGFPLFIKPRDGSASINAFKIHTATELAFFMRYVPAPVIQPFVEGLEVTTDVFSAYTGTPLFAVPRRRLRTRGGEVSVGRIERHPALEALCLRVAAALGATGPINIQAFVTPAGPLITEINPRFGGGCPLSIRAGAPLARWTIQQTLGRHLTPGAGTYPAERGTDHAPL